jgi:molybdopterin molybdotransferase
MTGDEVVPPGQTPLPGQIRDSNSTLIKAWLTPLPADLWQQHLPEDFERAKASVGTLLPQIENADLLLISGGASVGEKDFSRALIEFLDFEIVFHQVNLRPGAPLIFGVSGRRVAFGLPGNPLSHFTGWHAFVNVALARMTGINSTPFLSGQLATALADADCPRETLWPASCQAVSGKLELTPLRWQSAGDISCLAAANALIRVPAKTPALPAGTFVEYLSTPT